MDSVTVSNPQASSEVWNLLKRAIAHSSGFQRWLSEKQAGVILEQPTDLDACVTAYLRQALETLAY
ncbi:hypothetical protein [uncultured Thermosynechococcus sp.]|uniref:hypothetical protein n=1 Tax=uncultured Thermosynechococcus sp. TaxID=436945 RepID=UPI00260D6C58|nr:hypothetical protein [uncultured Thermosynechococcus sp.]